MLQIRLSKAPALEGCGPVKPLPSETVTVACPDHLVLADLPVAKGIGAATTASLVKTVGRRSRRQLGERVHFCVRCDFPIAIYGRLSPCEHAFCLDCARSDSICYLCDERIQKIQTIKIMEGILICAAPHCLKSFLKRADFESHIQDSHANLLHPNVEKEDGNDSEALSVRQSTASESTVRGPQKQVFSPGPNSYDRDDKLHHQQSREQPPLRASIQPRPQISGQILNHQSDLQAGPLTGNQHGFHQQNFDMQGTPQHPNQFPDRQQGVVPATQFPEYPPMHSIQPSNYAVPFNANTMMNPPLPFGYPPYPPEGAQPYFAPQFEMARQDSGSEIVTEQGPPFGFPPGYAPRQQWNAGMAGVPFEQMIGDQSRSASASAMDLRDAKGILAQQQQHPMHCDGITEEIKLLSEPFKIFEFDFWKRPDSHGETEIRIKAIDSGRVHAVISWWIIQLDREGTIFYSTAPIWTRSSAVPSSRDWCDHWKQCVWFVPGKGVSICNHEEINLHAVHTETTILYDLNIQVSRNELVHHGLLAGNLELILSPERIAIYGNIEWRLAMLIAMKKALQEKDHSSCLVVDDSVFLPLLIRHLSQTTHVISLFPGLRDKGIRYLEAVAHENGFAVHHIEFISKKVKCLSIDDLHQKKVDLLVAEPFYCTNPGMLPWENLRFWYKAHTKKERSFLDPLLTEDATIIPCKGILKACAMSLPDLWNSRCCLSNIEGFDHSVVNTTLGGCGHSPAEEYSLCLPYFIWQCGEFKELSGTLTLMEFDYSTVISICHGEVKFEFTKPGTCHGFVMWIDWVIDSGNSIVISTGPYNRFWKQGVKLLATPVEVDWSKNGGGCCSAILKATFDPVRGELLVGHDFSRQLVS